MSENFKVSSFDRLFDVKAVKIPYGGGYYKEVDEAVRRAISYNPRIKMVFRSLDKSFLMYDKDQWNPTAPAPDYLLDGNPWNDVNYIWNKEVIFGNVRSILNRTKAGADMTTFDEYMHWAPDKEWGRPVSYTHLDVYKRQGGFKNPNTSWYERSKRYEDGTVSYRWHVLRSLQPVSYTHLKIQPAQVNVFTLCNV